MNYRLSLHAERQLRRRQIERHWLESVLDTPEQRIAQPGGTEIWQSRFAAEDGKMYLLSRSGRRQGTARGRDGLSDRQRSEILEGPVKVEK
ncbi:MAG TPA: hypothetical protein VIY49_33575 [Bryobacteraceae bacterium]